MRLTIRQLKAFIKEAKYNAWATKQVRTGKEVFSKTKRLGEPVEVEANSDREATEKAADILRVDKFSVDVENVRQTEIRQRQKDQILLNVREKVSKSTNNFSSMIERASKNVKVTLDDELNALQNELIYEFKTSLGDNKFEITDDDILDVTEDIRFMCRGKILERISHLDVTHINDN